MSDQPTTINLNVSDIADAVKVIDHAAEQGAYHGWDTIRQILALRDRLDLFVKSTIVAIPDEELPEWQSGVAQ